MLGTEDAESFAIRINKTRQTFHTKGDPNQIQMDNAKQRMIIYKVEPVQTNFCTNEINKIREIIN
jgi:hypothetical protein